ncbi:MAG: hypothetical protein ICV73_15970 [Acetobacteraceae bacterium]|nr:hypothetical protein [Acetobacteraceae bacterium]
MRRLALALVAMAMVAAAYAWIAPMSSRDVHHFRLTVEVDTPDGVRSGSSVVEVERKDVTWLPVPGPRHEFRVRGEAVFVDLGSGRHVVAVLAHGENAEDVSRIITLWVGAYGRYKWDEDVWSGRTELQGTVELKPPLIPTLVTFADPLDPETVRVVRPGEFERVFGPGFRFRRATLEVVPASVPVTSGAIEQRLPWLSGMKTNLAGTRGASTNDLRERLTPLEFRRQDP